MDPDEQPNTRSWMGDLPDHVKAAPLLSLSIPGSHNSFTYTLERNGTAGPDQPAFVKELVKKFPGVSCNTLYKWSVTQGLNLMAQLESGIRYFDIRLVAVTEEGEREFRILHCLSGTKVMGLMVEIKKFLDDNKSEIVILDFQRLYEFEPSDHERLITLLETLFKDMLCSWGQGINKISLASLHASGARLILIYPAIWDKKYTELRETKFNSEKLSLLWGRNFCPTPWPDTASTATLKQFLNTKLKERDPSMMFISQGILTPDWKTIMFHPFSNLDMACSKKCNMAVKEWLKEIQTVNQRPNIVISDFVAIRPSSWDIINTVIRMNYNL